MNEGIKRLPDGSYIVSINPKELREVERKIERGFELDDREITIMREFGL